MTDLQQALDAAHAEHMDYEFLQLQLQECESASEQQTQASSRHMLSASLLSDISQHWPPHLCIEPAMHDYCISNLLRIVSTQTPHMMQLL